MLDFSRRLNQEWVVFRHQLSDLLSVKYGDIDNRVKSIVDALWLTSDEEFLNETWQPSDGVPYWVLIQDNGFISQLIAR